MNNNEKYYGNKQNNGDQIQHMSLSELKPFEAQPFKVRMDESMDELVESVKEGGVLTPLVVRPHKDGGYEILSGHRRAKASELAGRKTVPVIVRDLDDDMAAILLVDSNLQREYILPSEKAFAYQLKLEAMKHQGKKLEATCAQIAHKYEGVKSRDILAAQVGESKDQIRRYIRLTELIDPLLDMVDEKKLPLNAAVELSYLGTKAQADVVESIEKHETVPSIEQSAKIRRFCKDGKVNPDVIDSIMQEEKPEKLKVVLKEDRLREYFPKSYSQKQIEDTIMKLIKQWARRRSEPER
ncbi:MAG: ParB/RepB/Spo0J family partition protein [Clostridia bacterium]|nr:ParB/RepB/Spo0J family partition protein [Clostridia bacterium]